MINKDDLGDVLILNADDNTIHSSFHDLNKLPQAVVGGANYCFCCRFIDHVDAEVKLK